MRDIRQRGFSMIEMMVSLTVLIVGLVGIMGLQRAAVQASAYSRHATEASVLAEDKMEELRTVSTAMLASGTDTVDANRDDAGDYFTRTWTVTNDGTTHTIVIVVGWNERGGDEVTDDDYREIELRTQRPM